MVQLSRGAAVALGVMAMAPHGGHGIECSLSKLQDSEKTGILAYTYLLPKGWNATNHLQWNNQLPNVGLTAKSADGDYIVNRVEPFNINFMGGSNVQTTGTHLGGIIDYLHVVAQALEKQGLGTNFQIVDENSNTLPLLPMQQFSQSHPMPNTTGEPFHESGFLKVTFEHNGKTETASIGSTITGTNTVMKRAMPYGGQTFERDGGFYTVGPTLLVVAPENPSPAKVKEAQLIASSMSATPAWNMYLAKVALQNAQAGLDRTRATGKAQLEQFARDSARRMQNFRDQMAAKDANTHQFCNYILDQQDYKDPSGSIVTLPSNFKYAWANGQGNYYVTDDVDFNPKGTGAASGNWQTMAKAVAGKDY